MQSTHQIQPYDVQSSRDRRDESTASSVGEAGTAINVHRKERLASALLGGLAIVYGLTRRSGAAGAIAALGSALVYRGVTGHCQVYEALGFDTSGRDTALARGMPS